MIPSQTVSILIEALPYIQKFRRSTFVIKYGGAAMEDEAAVTRVLRDIVLLEAVGINPVVVHGGGKAITKAMKEAGLEATFIDGLRVTDGPSIGIIDQVLGNTINPGVVRTLKELGGKAEGLPGKDIFTTTKMNYTSLETGKPVDLGFVGDITRVNVKPIDQILLREVIPVISPLGRDAAGNVYNINADHAASEVAKALRADKLIYLSDVAGVMRDARDPSSIISSLTPAEILKLKQEGVISGGMVPKVDSAVEALEHGVRQVHFLHGKTEHSLLLEIFTDAGVGTEITL